MGTHVAGNVNFGYVADSAKKNREKFTGKIATKVLFVLFKIFILGAFQQRANF